MLKGGISEGVLDFEITHLPVRPLRVNKEFVVPPKEAGSDAFVFKDRIIEIAQDGFVVGYIHGQIVVGVLPVLIFLFVAVDTFFTAYKGRHPSLDRLPGLIFDVCPLEGVDWNR